MFSRSRYGSARVNASARLKCTYLSWQVSARGWLFALGVWQMELVWLGLRAESILGKKLPPKKTGRDSKVRIVSAMRAEQTENGENSTNSVSKVAKDEGTSINITRKCLHRNAWRTNTNPSVVWSSNLHLKVWYFKLTLIILSCTYGLKKKKKL